MKDLSELLLRIRFQIGLKRSEMAARLEVSVETLQLLEIGELKLSDLTSVERDKLKEKLTALVKEKVEP